MDSIRILIADDHTLLRQGLRALIEAQSDMVVVDEAGGGLEAVSKARKLSPNVVIIDLSMPGGGGINAISKIRADCPGTGVLVLTMHNDESYVRSAMAAGATGYIVKQAADTELISAIRAVNSGRFYLNASMGVTDAETDPQLGKVSRGSGSPDQLSSREKEVLKAVAEGYTNKEVASQLNISEKTVETYRRRINEKCGFQSRADIVRYALETGILHADDR